MEGAKYPGESWVACLIYLSDPLPSICVGLNANLAVVLLQMHCQMKLRRSPFSVFPFFKTWGRNFFLSWTNIFSCGRLDLVLDCNGFDGLHQYRFSFICRNPLVWWCFRLAARHFTESSLIWPFFDFLNRRWFLRKFLVFLCVIFFRLFMKGKSNYWKGAFFSWWLPIAFTPTSAFLSTCDRGFTFH